jgi:hypothetical protein
MSGHWPPEWDDPEEEFPPGNDQPDAEAEAQLSEVAAYLASVPAPVLPDAVEARIAAALATEAAARAEHAAPTDGARKLEPSGARARVRRHRGGDGSRRRFRVRPVMAAGSLVTCLLLAGLGFGIAQSHDSESTFSSAAAGSAPEPAGAASTSAASSAAGPAAVPSAEAPGAAGSSFAVTASGTKYQQATLAEQVRTRLGGGPFGTSGTAVPAASASATSAAAVPSQALRGCVLRLTGGAHPRLVDRATYEGEPAYVIADSSHVWVVGLGCTAAKAEVIASVPLAS